MNHLTLFDALTKTEDAILRSYEGSNRDWFVYATSVVHDLCHERERFTTDAIWAKMEGCGLSTNDPRALGAVMRYAAKAGWCVSTGEYKKSEGKRNHCRPVAIWQSNLTQ